MKPDDTLLDHFRHGAVGEQIAAREGPSMEIPHHISAEMQSSYLRGTISPGAALAVETHIGLCSRCRRDVGLPEHSGPEPRSLADLEEAERAAVASDPAPAGDVGLAALGRVTMGRWRRVAPGVRRSRLEGVSGLGESVHLLAAEAGAMLDLPAAAQLVVVLEGVVRVGASVQSRGDFIDAAGVRLKEASADGPFRCLCLVVGDAELYARPLVGMLKQRFARAPKPPR